MGLVLELVDQKELKEVAVRMELLLMEQIARKGLGWALYQTEMKQQLQMKNQMKVSQEERMLDQIQME